MNILKILENKKKQKEIEIENYIEKNYYEDVYSFINEFVIPIIKKRENEIILTIEKDKLNLIENCPKQTDEKSIIINEVNITSLVFCLVNIVNFIRDYEKKGLKYYINLVKRSEYDIITHSFPRENPTDYDISIEEDEIINDYELDKYIDNFLDKNADFLARNICGKKSIEVELLNFILKSDDKKYILENDDDMDKLVKELLDENKEEYEKLEKKYQQKEEDNLSKSEKKEIAKFFDKILMKKLTSIILKNSLENNHEFFYKMNSNMKDIKKEKNLKFLYSKNKDLKIEMANIVVDMVITLLDYKAESKNFFNTYMIPELEKLNKEKKIIFDYNSQNEEVKLITNNTIKLIIDELEYMTNIFLDFNMSMPEQIPYQNNFYDIKSFIKYVDFLIIKDENFKNIHSKSLCDIIVKKYQFVNLGKQLLDIDNMTTEILFPEDDIYINDKF